MQGDVITLLTRFEVGTNIAKNKTQFQIPEMGIKMQDTSIPQYVVDQYPDDLIDGEKWGIIKLVYIPPEGKEKGYIEMSKYKPFRPLERLDLSSFRECRKKFTVDEWIDVIISAMEYTPSSFANKTQKLEFIARLLPFIEPRLNLIELVSLTCSAICRSSFGLLVVARFHAPNCFTIKPVRYRASCYIMTSSLSTKSSR